MGSDAASVVLDGNYAGLGLPDDDGGDHGRGDDGHAHFYLQKVDVMYPCQDHDNAWLFSYARLTRRIKG